MKELVEIQGNKVIRKMPLEKRRYNLGRDIENDIVFDLPKISRLHAILIQEDNTYVIVDNHSTNHVFVNGEPVQKRRLAGGDRINLSKEVTLLYQCKKSITDKLPQQEETIKKNDFIRLKEVTNRIISLDSLDNILEMILSEVIELVDAERGFIALTNERGEIQTKTNVSYNISLHQNHSGKSVFSHSVVQWVVENKERRFILNTEDQPGVLSKSVLDLNLTSIMCTPLLFGDKLSGILYVDSGYQLTDFNEMDQLFFTILADHAAIAIENAKRYDQIQRSNIKLKGEVTESEERYRQLVELSPDAIAVHSEGKIVFVNPAAVKLMGAKNPEDLIGKSVMDRVHPDCRRIVTTRMRRQLEKGKSVPVLEEKFLKLNGESVDVDVTAAPLTYQGKPAVQVFIRDITERKQMERELLRAQKLESVGILAGGIAHDFNNFLQAIIGNAILAKMEADTPSRVTFYLDEVEKAVSRATTLTAQLLTFSKGGVPVTRAASIEQLIEESVAFALRGSKAAYKLNFEEKPPLVEIDSNQISQVIHNLAINALQAMPMGGIITISTAQVEIGPKQPIHSLKPGQYVKISVADEGIGIPEKILDKVFDPYFTTKQEGSGLGLASCYSIISQHSGIIKAESTEGQGTTFTFYLPVSEKSLEKEEPIETVVNLEGKVLVMDDDDVVRNVASKMLQTMGCQVELASEGGEAIELYARAKEAGSPFDLVIFDLTVPGKMGGKEAIEKLRAYDPDVTAIVASGYSNDPVMSKPAEYGFQGVISKPFGLEKMIQVVKELLQ